MTEPHDLRVLQPLDAPPAGSRRRLGIWLPAFALVIVVLAAVVVILVRANGSNPAQLPHPTRSSRPAAPNLASTRLTAIRGLLRRRSEAVLHHRRAGFLATVDPAAVGFRRHEAAMFANLARVKFASWSYSVASAPAVLPAGVQSRYAAPTWAPSDFVLHYRIAGFDAAATDLPQYPTFVQRSGRWYLGSLTDFRRDHLISATDLWDYAPVHVVRRHSVLVLGPRSELGTMVDLADQAEAAIPKVTAVWGPNWARRVVVLVPSTQHEMGLVDADHEDLNQIAALTSSEISSTAGHPAPVGDRVTINPRNWPKLGPLGAQIVLTHEFTHVASRADTGSQTPKWLSEGFADYVGFRDADVSVTLAAAELASAVRDGKQPRSLPTDAAFRGASKTLSQAYEASWLACRYIAARFGQPALVRFYRAVGRSDDPTSLAVSNALHRVLGLSRRQFSADWHRYVRAELA